MPQYVHSQNSHIIVETTPVRAAAYNKMMRLYPDTTPTHVKEQWVIDALIVKNKLYTQLIKVYGTMFGEELKGQLIEKK